MRFHVQKYEMYLKSKNYIKRSLQPFNIELWAFSFFFNCRQIFKPSIRLELTMQKNGARFAPQRCYMTVSCGWKRLYIPLTREALAIFFNKKRKNDYRLINMKNKPQERN